MQTYKIAILDFGCGNLFSISEALKYFKFEVNITNVHKKILESDVMILPGVGSFKTAMNKIKKQKLDLTIEKFINTGKPVIGVCLGFQLLFENSYEFKKTKGLGIFKGDVLPFENKKKNSQTNKLNIGWNNINIINPNNLLDEQFKKKKLYFVHSYFVKPKDKNLINSYSYFDNFEFCSSINYKNIYAFQFHPEKSGFIGINIYKNISKILN
jgi:glutamine amidotransferase